jgi:hypothetical protein
MGRHGKVPSENSVPHQVKFPHEAAANADIMGTSRPRTDASAGYPGEFPLPDIRTYWEMNAADGAFNYISHTNGKKKE